MLTIRCLLAVLLGVTSVVATRHLELKLSGPSRVDGVHNLKVSATVINTGDEFLKLLNDPNGPLSKIPTDTFSLSHESGLSPDFIGVMAKYVPSVAAKTAGPDAFTVLAPGESVTLEHDLSEAYDFAASGAGTYTIEANHRFLVADPHGGDPKVLYATQPTAHNASLSGALTVVRPTVTKRETYTKCSDTQQSVLVTAALAAQSYAASALAYASSHTASTARYTTWFGAYSAANHNTILTHFTNLNSNNYSAYAFDCYCTDSGVYAYSFPSNYGKVFLCGSFWIAPVNGTDSQGGTLIHESTHFTKNAGTQDYAYGQTDCQTLAKSTPSEAIMNADSHEYFAENNPVLA